MGCVVLRDCEHCVQLYCTWMMELYDIYISHVTSRLVKTRLPVQAASHQLLFHILSTPAVRHAWFLSWSSYKPFYIRLTYVKVT